MSSVWIAERIDGLLKRRVALKLPHVSWAMPEAAGRMARERDLLASLEHPNIARLYDAGVGSDGRPFLALELVDGVPIDEYCAARNADNATRVRLVLQTARAVDYAHSRSIVHRDLKPSNILVDAAGQVRLLDFGIGKLLESDAPAPGNETQFGGRLFTPDYASPEQTRGEAVTASTDVFSLGVVLYQLLCSQLPFPRASRESDSDRNARAAPRVLRGDLDTIVQKALKESVPGALSLDGRVRRRTSNDTCAVIRYSPGPTAPGTGCASSPRAINRCCAPSASRSPPPPRSASDTSSTCRGSTAHRLRARSSCLRMPSRSGRFRARHPRAMSRPTASICRHVR